MKIIEKHVLNGPNYWSVKKHKLIVARIDIEEYEELPSNKLEGFSGRLEKAFPGMYQHQCSEGIPGGFFERVRVGTWMGHIIEHIALELQILSDMNCYFGRTRSTQSKGIYQLVFEYQEERAGLHALYASMAIAEALAHNKPYDLQKEINILKKIASEDQMGPSTSAIVNAALKRNIPYFRLDKESLIQLGYGAEQKRINATITSQTSNIAVDIASDKELTKEFLRNANIPVPDGFLVNNENDFKNAVDELEYPLTIKPQNSNHGKGVRLNLKNYEDAFMAFERAKFYSENIIVEKFIEGNDYRLLLINYKFIAAARRIPAMIVGDGKNSIEKLVEITNMEPNRGESHEKVLTKIKIDHNTPNILINQGHTLVSIPAKEEKVYLKQTANLSSGGTSMDVTEIVHPDIIGMAERAARIIGLDICGIDLISKDISKPLKDSGLAIIEINAAPGFRMHTHPFEGKPRDVGTYVIDMLFPANSNGRIPIVAITGTNGKTTTARILAHIAKVAGYTVGLTTTEGVYIHDEMIEDGDCTGPSSAEKVLKDPLVNFAVLECARGGMLRSGLAFDQCDTGIVTNVAEDHIGLRDIHSIEEMAHVKSIIPETVKPNGYAILNADNEHTYRMKDHLHCNIAFFSTLPEKKEINEHIVKGGLAACLEDGNIFLIQDSKNIYVENLDNIPIAFGGKAKFMIENIMAAILAACVHKIPVAVISKALQTFIPSTENTPGRLNKFNFRQFSFIIDYAHNYHGLKALGEYLNTENYNYKIGIVSIPGDRRDVDIINIGRAAAEIFNKIIIRIDEDTRGRTGNEISSFIIKGVQEVNRDIDLEIVPGETSAIMNAIYSAFPGTLIVLLSEKVKHSIEIVQKLFEMDQKNETPDLSMIENVSSAIKNETYQD